MHHSPSQPWCCAHCTLLNDAGRKVCSACRKRKCSSMQRLPTDACAVGSSIPLANTQDTASQQWSCARCTLRNDAGRKSCSACRTRKNSSRGTQGPGTQGPGASLEASTASEAEAGPSRAAPRDNSGWAPGLRARCPPRAGGSHLRLAGRGAPVAGTRSPPRSSGRSPRGLSPTRRATRRGRPPPCRCRPRSWCPAPRAPQRARCRRRTRAEDPPTGAASRSTRQRAPPVRLGWCMSCSQTRRTIELSCRPKSCVSSRTWCCNRKTARC